MNQKKRVSSVALFIWFLFVIVFLAAWNADRFVEMMGEELPGITPANAKVRTDRWDLFYTEYFRFMEPLAQVSGASYLALAKRSVDNYAYVKDADGNMQLLENNYSSDLLEENIKAVSDVFEKRGIPLIYVSLPPRFDDADFKLGSELGFFGQRDEALLSALAASGVETLDAGGALKAAGLRYLYPLKTDIHLNTEGEIETARLVAARLESIGVAVKDEDVIFDKNQFEVAAFPFTGNLVKTSGSVFTLGGDDFELWYPEFETDLTVTNPDSGIVKQGPFRESIMNGMDSPESLAGNSNPYLVLNYLQYPSGYYTVENNLNKDGSKLLFIIDSYAMRTAAYLSPGVGEITVIDPRGYSGPEYLARAMASGEYDAVIMAAGGMDFYKTANEEGGVYAALLAYKGK